jgi:hypothetical protein
MFRRGFLLVLVVLLECGVVQADPKADSVLAHAKHAMGGSAWDAVRVLRTTADVQASGLEGPSLTVEDVSTGAYVNTYKLGTFTGADGYDGKTVWNEDPSGQVAVQGGDDARQGAVDAAYRAVRGYWYPRRMKAEVQYEGTTADGGRTFDVLRMTPSGGRPFDMWFDADAHVIDRIVEKTANDVQTTYYSDYWRVSAVLLPFAWRQSNGDTRYDTVVKIKRVEFEDSVSPAVFAPPPPPKRDFGFEGGRKSVTVPFKLVNNHMYIPVKLNGRGPYEMLLDTGAENVIMPTLARELGLELQGSFQGGGTGEQTVDVAATSIDRVEIGDAFLDHQTFASSALESFGNVEGRPFVGIIGYEIFKRFVVRTDFDAQQVTLSEPEGYSYQGPGLRVPFQLKDTIPIVPGDIDGVPGTFQLDTGSRLTLELMAPFVARNALVARYAPKMQGVTGWGVGGSERTWIVRARSFTFGGVAVDAPVMGLSQSTRGSGADAYISGNVGTDIFRKFNIVWDYPRNQLFFERNSHYAEPDVFNRAGIWVNLGGDGFDVVDVYAGSPAADAGLMAGDRIVAVDGRQAQREISLPEFRARMREAPGTKLHLDIERGDRKFRLTVTLRDLV